MTNLDSILKSRDITLSTKVCLVKAMVFPVVMYGCESWTIKKAEHWRIDAFKLWCWKRLLRPLDCKEIQPVHPKDQSWVFTGRTDVEAETPILWPPDMKSWLIWKDPDARKDWGQEEKGTTKDEMVGWHYQLNGYGFGWTPGVGDGIWGGGIHGVAKSQTQIIDWTELNIKKCNVKVMKYSKMSTYELSYLKIRYPMTLKLLVCFCYHPVSLINLVSNFSLLTFCLFQFDLISNLQKISQRVTGNSYVFFNQFCILLTCSPFCFAGYPYMLTYACIPF